MGHAAFEFIESKWGKEGLRQFLFALRKSVIGGGNDAYQEAFRIDPDDFDDQFDKYLKERFKPFRDLERPTDYGKDLAPKPEKTPFVSAVSIEPSPSGDLLAVAAGNRKDQELDIILVSSKDGQVIRNLTKGFDTGEGWEYITQPGGQRFDTVPWMAWAPAGDRLAYFVRTEKYRTLVLQNVVTRKVEKRVEIKTVDSPESPDFDPTGRRVAFAGLREAVPDLFELDLDTGAITNLTHDDFAEYAPAYSPDGKFLVYVTRVSGNDKLFKLDLATKQKTQLTFGTHDDSGPHFIDDRTLVFSSTATDPNVPVDPEVAKNGQIFNVWTLDLQNGELRRYTDTATAALSPVVLHEGNATRFAFVTYFKGDFGIHAIERKEADLTVASSDFGAPGPIIDFQAPLQHTLVKANERKKGTFEKMFLDGRPPINLGVTSNGDIFGGTSLTFSDVLGDQQFNMYAASISQYRTLLFSYMNLAHRFQWASQVYSQTLFYYGLSPGVLYDPAYSYISRDQALSTQTARGGALFGIYPISRYARIELSGGLMQYKQQFNDSSLQAYSEQYQQQVYGTPVLANGTFAPLGVAYTRETTVFRDYGPLSGDTMRLSYRVRTEGRAPALAPDGRPRRPVLHAHRHQRRAGVPGPRLQELGRPPRLHLLRWQLRHARVRLPAVPRPARLLRKRRAALPADRGHGDTSRRARRHPGRVLLRHRRGGLQQPVLPGGVEEHRRVDADHRVCAELRHAQLRPGLRGSYHRLRLPSQGRARVLRHRPRDLRAGLPDPLRLVVAHDVQQELGGLPVRGRTAAAPSSAGPSSRSGLATTSSDTGVTAAGGTRTRPAGGRPAPDVLPMKPCSEVVSLLVEYLEGQLPPQTHAKLERHLSRCAACVAHVRSYQSTVSLLHSIREQDLPDELRLSLRAFLDRQGDN